MGTKVLVTGGTGFAGSHLTELLVKDENTEVHVTQHSTRAGFVHQLLPSSQIHSLDISDETATTELLTSLQPDQLYHLAAYADVGNSYDNASHAIKVNSQIQISILNAVRKVSPQTRVLTVSSAAIYKPSSEPMSELNSIGPLNPYGISKTTQDLLSQAYTANYHLDTVIARPFNHIGERQEPHFVVPAFAQQIVAIEQGELKALKVGNLDAVRDFSDVKDVVRAYQAIMNKGTQGEAYNVGSGVGVKVKDILQTLLELATIEVEVVTDPTRLRPSDVPYSVADNSKLQELGWFPEHHLPETLTRILTYWRNQ